jgi:hypothetical protein
MAAVLLRIEKGCGESRHGGVPEAIVAGDQGPRSCAG